MKQALKVPWLLTRSAVVFALYVGSYLALTLLGDYRLDMTGRLRMNGLAMMDTDLWQPRGMYFRVFINISGRTRPEGSLVGMIYSPLIMVDRALWHHDHVFDVKSEGGQSIEPDQHPATAP